MARVLDEYNFLGKPPEKRILAFNKWVSDNDRENIPEIIPPKIYYDYLKSVLDALAALGRDIGFDLSRRMPQISHIHLLSFENFSNHFKNTDMGKPELTAGFVTGTTKNVYIKWKSKESIFRTMSTIQHELIHQLSSKNVYFYPDKPKFRVSLGYSIPPESKYKPYSESVTEIINIHICKNYWPKFPSLKELPFENNAFTYLKERHAIKKTIEYYSNVKGLNQKVILVDLIRGLFTGDISFFDRYPIFSKIS